MKLHLEITPMIESIKHFVHHIAELGHHGQKARVAWEEIDSYVIITALGTHHARVMALTETSKRNLDIPVEKLVLLPGQSRRARLEQATEFCVQVLRKQRVLDAFQLTYLIELFEADRKDIAAVIDCSDEEIAEILEQELDFTEQESAELAGHFLSMCESAGKSYELAS